MLCALLDWQYAEFPSSVLCTVLACKMWDKRMLSNEYVLYETVKGKRTSKKSINFFLKYEKNNLKLAI